MIFIFKTSKCHHIKIILVSYCFLLINFTFSSTFLLIISKFLFWDLVTENIEIPAESWQKRHQNNGHELVLMPWPIESINPKNLRDRPIG